MKMKNWSEHWSVDSVAEIATHASKSKTTFADGRWKAALFSIVREIILLNSWQVNLKKIETVEWD